MKTSLKVCNTKQILIDGFNLIYKFPDLEELISRGDLRGAMRGLLDILKDYGKAADKKIRVVFDGKKESGINTEHEKAGGMDVYYSIDYTADFIIMNMIKHDHNHEAMALAIVLLTCLCSAAVAADSTGVIDIG